MDIRLDDKAVAPARQPLADVVVAKAVAVPHHQLVDVSQRVLVQQRDIPNHLVIGIRHRFQLAVPEQLAQHHVRVGVFPNAGRSRSQVLASAPRAREPSTVPSPDGRPSDRNLPRTGPAEARKSPPAAPHSNTGPAGQAGSPGCRPATSRQSGSRRSLPGRASAQNAPASASQTPTRRSRNPQRATPDHCPEAHRAPLPRIRSNSLYSIMIKAACATPKTPRSTPEQPDSGPSRQVPDRSQRVLVQ